MRVLGFTAMVALLVATTGAQTVDFSPVHLDATQPVPGRTFTANVSYPAGPGAPYILAFDPFRAPQPYLLPGIGQLGLAGSPSFLFLQSASLNPQGKGTFSLPLPPGSILIGLQFHLQALVFTPRSTAGAFLSNLYVGQFTGAGTHTLIQARARIPRALHSSTLLQDGRVLIIGGGNGSLTSPVATQITEIYHPWTKNFDYTRTPLGAVTRLNTMRVLHTATLLQDGRVLIAGGVDSQGNVVKTAEVFDPATGLFTYVSSLLNARATHTASLLPDGRVLIAGGTTANFVYPNVFGGATKTTEIFDPTSNAFKAGPNMREKRMIHSAVPLRYGGQDYVLMLSGIKGLFLFILPDYTNTAEVYDVTAKAFTNTIGSSTLGTMKTSRVAFGAALQANNRVVVVGGATGTVPAATKNAEEFNPATGACSSVTSMQTERVLPGVTTLPGGQVLVQGGALGSLTAPSATASCYLYSAGSFATAAALTSSRGAHTSILLPSGVVLVIGGANSSAQALDTAEYYTP